MPGAAERARGERFSTAAKRAGWTANDLAAALGYTAAAVRQWWRGETGPPYSVLEQYGRLVGASVQELVSGPLLADPHERAEDVLLAVIDRIAAGEEPDAAHAAATDGKSQFSRRERARMRGRGPLILADVQARTGRPWEELSLSERRALVRQWNAETPEEPEVARPDNAGPPRP